MAKSPKFKLVLSSWQLAAIESLLDGTVKLDALETTSLEALKANVVGAWSQQVRPRPKFGEGKSNG